MPNTYAQLLYHVVFSTKNRVACIDKERRDDLYRYFWGVHKRLKCHLYRIGGTNDHVHLLASLPRDLALTDYVTKLKTGSTNWIRAENVFAQWPGWQDGYGAFTASFEAKDRLIDYIKAQEEHHRHVSFLEEFEELLQKAGINYDGKYVK